MRIALLGEYNPSAETHIATERAVDHSSAILNQRIIGEWISSDAITSDLLDTYDGLWVTPGPPHRNIENTLQAITHARERGIPTFGNCGGFQLLVVELARKILGLHDAHHEEYSPSADVRVVVPMACSLRGQELPVTVVAPSLASSLYQRTHVVERYYCRYGINPLYRSQFVSEPLTVAALDHDGEIRAFEVRDHPFWLMAFWSG